MFLDFVQNSFNVYLPNEALVCVYGKGKGCVEWMWMYSGLVNNVNI